MLTNANPQIVLIVISVILTFATIGTIVWTWRLNRQPAQGASAPSENTAPQPTATISGQTTTPIDEKKERVGHYLGPADMIFVRFGVSAIIGLAVTLVLFMVDRWMEVQLLDRYSFVLLSFLFTVLVSRKDKEILVVPPEHVAILKVLGARVGWYLEEGDYDWYGDRLTLGRLQIFGINRTPIGGMDDPSKNVLPDTPGEANGFVFIGDRVMQIWHDTADKAIQLSNIARSGSTVFTKITITIRTVDPMLWMKSSDPVLRVAEQTRTGFRMAIEFFRDLDVAGLQNALRYLMMEMWILTSFIRKNVEHHLTGAVVRDESGFPMYEVVRAGATKAELDEAEVNFAKKLESNADYDMLEAAKGKSGKPVIARLHIEDTLTAVTDQVGAELNGFSISDVDLSTELKEFANKAAAEGKQRQIAIATAEAQTAARKLLRLEPGEEDDVLARLLAASNDGTKGIQYVFLPDAVNKDSLVRAAVAGGSQIGGNMK